MTVDHATHLAEIIADPDAIAPYLVYGDALQADGDPRGELIAIQHALAITGDRIEQAEFLRRESGLLDANPQWFGDMIEHREHIQLRWARGFVHAARVSSEPAHRAVVASAPAVAELRLGVHDPEDGHATPQEMLAALHATWPAALRRLHVGHADHKILLFPLEAPLDELVVIGKAIDHQWTTAPPVKRMHLRGRCAASKLGKFAWPDLEELELWFANEAMLKILDTAKFPKLRVLRLRYTTETDAIAKSLMLAPAVRDLEILDLVGGTATALGIKNLAKKLGDKLDVRGNFVGGKKAQPPQRRAPKTDENRSPLIADPNVDLANLAVACPDAIDERIRLTWGITDPAQQVASLLDIFEEAKRSIVEMPHATMARLARMLDETGKMPEAECILWHCLREVTWKETEDATITCLGHLATLRSRRGDGAMARPLIARVAAHYEAKKFKSHLAWARRQQGNVELVTSNFAAAETFYNEALQLYVELNDTKSQALVMSELSGVCWSRQDYDGAVALLRKSIAMRGDDLLSAGSTYYNLGAILNGMAKIAEAIEAGEKSLELFTNAKHRHGMGMAKSLLGELHQRNNDHAKATELIASALEDHRISGGKREQGVTLGNLGRVHLDLEDYAAAIQCFVDGIEIHREVGNVFNEGMQLMDLARAQLGLSQREEALENLAASLVVFQKIANHPGIAAVEYWRGYAYHLANNLDVAAEDYRRSIASAILAKSEDQTAAAELALALAVMDSDRAEAEALFAAAENRSTKSAHALELIAATRAVLDGKTPRPSTSFGARMIARLAGN